jgi:hypothetical protein
MQSVTFAFGHSVGEGVQMILQGAELPDVLLATFMNWEVDPALEDTKRKKSLYLALAAIKQFHLYYTNVGSQLAQYELVYYDLNGVSTPALELPFMIELPDGFKFRGKVDAVLRHIVTGAILVLEVKTTSLRFVNPAMYKNSAQAIGYSVVLDKLVPQYSDYKVLYMPYITSSMQFEVLEFNKSVYQRARWLRELLLTKDILMMYEREDLYPMNGSSCFNYNRECKYYNLCTLSTNSITKPMTPELEQQIARDNEQYYLKVSILDLIQAQIDASTAESAIN